ncbi:Flp pilus assembly protein CpaB [Marinobacter halodurans]|uniref:Flp pilus assembly protein CpaB n=1 Tax=Marinobacter halodurans TaxID=2528979 RepID=A0ABY1ZGV9_9GAMM|nr:Flp pilus assembly protein CpaB [Marinobacter halodurans]TBW51845.1 Flp pilus assembly protein CpaB [Marinobacter halodurans]
MGSRALYALPAIVLALIALILAGIGFANNEPPVQTLPHEPAKTTTMEQAAPSLFEYLVVTRPIASGEPIGEDQVSRVGTAQEVKGAISADRFKFGTPAVGPIQPGAILTRDLLSSTSLITPRIKPGHQAIALKMDEVTGVGGLLKPGDRVNVLATFQRDRQATPTAVTVVRGAPVLAVQGSLGSDSDAPDKERRNDSIVLLIPDARVPAVLLASNEGKVRLAAIAAPEDTRSQDTATDSAASMALADLFPKPPAPPKSQPVRRAPANKVEVFEGSESRKVYVR